MTQKLLIVDDEETLTELLCEHFHDQGYLTYGAHCGKEALARLQVQPDLILLDINMPDVDGMTLCRQIRDHVNCPILFLTAQVAEQDKVNGLSIGGDDYITKPFSLAELTARVEAHLRRDARTQGKTSILSSGDLIVNLNERSVFWKDKELSFSRREFDIIEFLLVYCNWLI